MNTRHRSALREMKFCAFRRAEGAKPLPWAIAGWLAVMACLPLAREALAQSSGPQATMRDELAVDNNGNAKADAGDTLRYTVRIASPGDSPTTGSQFTILPGANTAYVPGSLHSTPIARDDQYQTNQGQQLNVAAPGALGNDNDPDGSALHVVSYDNPSTQGGVTQVFGNGRVRYTPPAKFQSLTVGQSATDSFRYTINDTDANPDTAVVTVTVHGLNDPPVARRDNFSTNEDTPILGQNVEANNGHGVDFDVDGDPLTVSAVNGHAADVGTSITLASGAQARVQANGDFDFDPNGQFETLGAGQSTQNSLNYTISDGHGGTDSANVTVTILGVNDPPVARDDDFATTEDLVLSGRNLLADNGHGADSDIDGGALTVTAVNGNAADVGTSITLGSGALVRVLANGNLEYDPNGAFETLGAGQSTQDSFSYTISDGHGGTSSATVTVTINGQNEMAIAQNGDFAAPGDTLLGGDFARDPNGKFKA
ncbi:MAG: Ig-like domain-containing protein [Candidatus Sumerlaeota bacterium]|nr:Ig-like domain-containing protein [Candidatus Sumerlaeota bacterium]